MRSSKISALSYQVLITFTSNSKICTAKKNGAFG